MKPLVSISCITYNQESYISDALESILMQETNFSFEIIVHDDASTDNTVTIIKKYEKKYPGIIKPIYQEKNQHTKGRKINFECVFPYVRGKYIAFCEGDDYWDDKNKLQNQVDFLQKNSKYSSCFHGVKVVNTNKTLTGRNIGPYGKGNKDYEMRDNISGGFIHISSLMMRANLIEKGMPKWALESRHGDYALFLLISANGKVFYFDKLMSSYRSNVENSVMTTLRKNSNTEKQIIYYKQRIKTLEEANKYYNYKFHNEIKNVVYRNEIKILLLKNEYKKLFKSEYKSLYKNNTLSIVKIFMLTKLPRFSRYLSKLKNKVKIIF